ncbi:MAG: hypothetical protein UZ11_BCD004002132 [Bacteroidetes bacterium OLB11]|nr:MAG: hypothetical protein UZ11_BCD004002132 [Bacteroidetes bacterium OLB11]
MKNEQFDYLVINKKIDNQMMENKQESYFSSSEIDELSQQKSVAKIGKIVSNQFAIEASNIGDISFSSQLFFEAIPDEFLDVQPKEFQWQEGQKTIPILLSQDFLNLYNFGFALSQGLPQLSEETVTALSFDVLINRDISLRAEVVGFTKRYTSIVVPMSFMQYANQHFGGENIRSTSRIVLQTQEPDNPDLVKYINEKHYETQSDKTKGGKIKYMLNLIFLCCELLGIFILSLCVFLIILFLKIKILESKEQLKLLSLLGYDAKSLQHFFLKPMLIYFALAIFISLICTQIFTTFLFQFFKPFLLDVSKYISGYVIGEGVLILLFIYLILF